MKKNEEGQKKEKRSKKDEYLSDTDLELLKILVKKYLHEQTRLEYEHFFYALHVLPTVFIANEVKALLDTVYSIPFLETYCPEAIEQDYWEKQKKRGKIVNKSLILDTIDNDDKYFFAKGYSPIRDTINAVGHYYEAYRRPEGYKYDLQWISDYFGKGYVPNKTPNGVINSNQYCDTTNNKEKFLFDGKH